MAASTYIMHSGVFLCFFSTLQARNRQ